MFPKDLLLLLNSNMELHYNKKKPGKEEKNQPEECVIS